MSLEAISTTERFAKTCRSDDKYLAAALLRATPALYQRMNLNGRVKDAYRTFIRRYNDSKADTIAPATSLLNAISLVYHEHATDGGPAVAFGSGELTHAFIRIDNKPDWVAYETTSDGLRTASGNTKAPQDCSTLLGAGESSLFQGGETQLPWLLNIVKRYRPDIATIHGLRFDPDSKSVHLSSLDAAGTSTSRGKPVGTLDTWIAHVVLLYDALAHRDTRFTFRGHGSHAARWSFKHDSDAEEEICFEPVYSAAALGKMTWAGYTTCQHPSGSDFDGAVHGDEAIGVFKVSWQNTKHATNEGELLDRAHRDTWLPGLVRHWGSWRADGPGLTVSDGNYTRIKDIVHLASIGEPLSQCGSVREILEVIFDAVCTLMELNKRGIIHRDISWYNLMRHARHNPALLARDPQKKVTPVEQVPCIRYVLTGDRDAEPCALVTDLDISAPFAPDTAAKYEGLDGSVGTRMFMSLERSSETRKSRSQLSKADLAALQDRLFEVEKHSEIFDRALPGDKGKFKKFIQSVFKAEGKRKSKQPYTPADIGHHPRHDVESLHWILHWSLARALPIGCEALDERGGDMSQFVDSMLEASRRPTFRSRFFKESNIAYTLHPKLRKFAPLLENMVRYLSVPWDRHHRCRPNNDVELYHAHIAYIRLLLEEIRLLDKYPERDVFFDTSQPRIRNLRMDDALRYSGYTRLAIDQTPSTLASADEQTTGATSTTLLPTDGAAREVQPMVVSNLKRKQTHDNEDNGAAAKRQKREPLPRVTVTVLADMFRADRKLWSSGGHRVAASEELSQAAGSFIGIPRSDEAQLRAGQLDSAEEVRPCPAVRPYSEEA